jgi:dimethylglycine dehydrogenase
MSDKQFPSHARVVIVGGGVMGVGLAYHLAHEGWGPRSCCWKRPN